MTVDDNRATGDPPAAPAGGRLGGGLQRTRRYGWLRFLIEATLIALLLRIPVVWLGAPIVGDEARTAYDWLEDYGPLELFALAVILGPILETALAQWAPIALGRRLFRREDHAIFLSAWIFAWLHFTQGALLVLIMFTTGLVLAWTFVVWRERGLWPAFLMTFAVHALLNSVALGAALAAPEVVEPPAEAMVTATPGTASHHRER